jgi:transcriptional regulator with XRE-family HTH domain
MSGMTEMPDPALVPEWTLGWRLQRSLAHAEITVNEIADALNVSRATISRWINDRGAAPRPIYVKEWALRTGVPYTWLAYGTAADEH